MKITKILALFALATGVFVSCGEGDVQEIASHSATLTVVPGSQKIAADGSASFTFSVSLLSGLSGQAEDISHYTATISFEATGGSVSPASATTDATGSVSVTFTTPDPQGFTGGTVRGTVKKIEEDKKDGLFQQGDLATATADVLPLNAEEPVTGDDPIKKAEKLDDNTYVVQKKGEEGQIYPLSQEESRWYVGRSYYDRTQPALKLDLMDEDPELSTVGWGYCELPTAIANKLTTINQEFYQKYPWASAKIGSFRTGKEVGAHMGVGGNVKLDGSSQIWIKEKSGTKGYSGLYQFLFVLVFENESYDSSTGEMVPDGEYAIIGNAVLEEYFPTLSYFRMTPSTDWVQVGQSVKLDADWDDGAEFDVTKVKLIGQTKGSSSSQDVDEGYFSWDASSQTLTALKSSDNVDVYLKFAYGDTDMKTTCQVATGNGWQFTSFSFDPARLVMDKYDYMYLSIGDYGPKNVGSWDWMAIELDPDTNPNDAFYYSYNYHSLSNYNTKAGETYNLRFRIRNNHSVTAPLEVYVVDKKPDSFTITYQHNNDYIHDDSIHGVCNYGMGLSLGVITNPDDAYWNWADVELANDYDGFSFSGHGGRDDHPKLQRTKSNPGGGTSYGTQIIFRLKYDHKKTNTIYVDHN